jgi:hypothetical protein
MLVIVVISALRPAAWLALEWRHCPGGICTASGTPPEWDFAIFWIGGRLARLRDFSDLFVFSNFHQYIAAHFHYDIGLSPFAYPPPVLLLFAPLAFLPLPVAYALWIAAGTAALLAALRLAGLRWAGCCFVLSSPPFLYNLLLGQNGAFTAALLLAALSLAAARPVRAGWFAALLLIKPQIGLLVPAAWAGGRHGQALAVSILAAAALAGASVLVFGPEPWQLYLAATLPEMRNVMTTAAPQYSQVNSITSFVLLRALGLSVAAATVCEWLIALAACIFCFFSCRRAGAETALAVTVLLSLLVMPYGHTYDMVAYAAVLALIAQARGPSLALAFFWFWPAVSRDVMVQFAAPVTPLVILAALAWVVRLGARPARPA